MGIRNTNIRDPRETWDLKDIRDSKDIKCTQDIRDTNNIKDTRDIWDTKDTRNIKYKNISGIPNTSEILWMSGTPKISRIPGIYGI